MGQQCSNNIGIASRAGDRQHLKRKQRIANKDIAQLEAIATAGRPNQHTKPLVSLHKTTLATPQARLPFMTSKASECVRRVQLYLEPSRKISSAVRRGPIMRIIGVIDISDLQTAPQSKNTTTVRSLPRRGRPLCECMRLSLECGNGLATQPTQRTATSCTTQPRATP